MVLASAGPRSTSPIQWGTSGGSGAAGLSHPTGEHGLDILNDDDVSRGIIREAFEFLSRVLLWSVAGCGPTLRVRLRQGGGKLEPHLRGDGALRASQYCVWRGPATVADAAHGLA